MKVFIFNRQKAFSINSSLTQKAVFYFLKKEKVNSSEVALYFVTKREIKKLHFKYFNDNTSTDCLSFPLDSPTEKGFLGEVFICPQTALEYAKKKRLNPKEEVLLYVVHSLLHLLGFKDLPKKEKIRMRKKEKESMEFLKTNLLGLIKDQWA